MATKPPEDNVHPMTLAPVSALKAQELPPHVIALRAALAKTAGLPSVGGLLVAWYELDGQGRREALRFEVVGDDDTIMGLCERAKFAVMAGAIEGAE
jgi:hypothetical protein